MGDTVIPQIEIKENKYKKILALGVVLVVLIALVGMLRFLVFPLMAQLPVLKLVVSIPLLALPLFAIYVILRGLLSSAPALIVNDKGITDNAVQSGVGFVPWSDIVDFKHATNRVKQKLLLLYVRNPIDYISRINGMKSGVLMSYYNQFGTPIVINLFEVDDDHGNLKDKIDAFFRRFQEST